MRNQPCTCEEASFTVHRAPNSRAHRAAVEVMDAHAQPVPRDAAAVSRSTACKVRSQSSARFSAVLNLFFTGAVFNFVKYRPEMALTSGDEARNTDVLAPTRGEIESGSDRYDTSRRMPGACSIIRVRTMPGCTAF